MKLRDIPEEKDEMNFEPRDNEEKKVLQNSEPHTHRLHIMMIKKCVHIFIVSMGGKRSCHTAGSLYSFCPG